MEKRRYSVMKNLFRRIITDMRLPAVSALILCLYVVCILSLQIVPAISKSTRKIPVYSVETSEKKIAITFDAAWGADKTREIMDICDQYGIKATFFLVGFWVEKYPELTAEITKRGFETGTHSQTHPNLPKLSVSEIEKELTTSVNLIEQTASCKVKVFRPPFGDYDNKLIETAEKLNLTTIQWDVDTLDWKGLSAAEILLRVEKNVRNGSIILCHNNSKHITDALPLIINSMQGRGYSFVTVSELIYTDNFYVDHTGRQHKNVA